MADNFLSYNRFTALPPVISRFGWTEEEANAARGRPDPNPVVSPMAVPKASAALMALSPTGSDRLRLANPAQPMANPYEGPKMTLVLSRNTVRKLSGQIIANLQSTIQSGVVADQKLQTLMLDSIRRVLAFKEYLGHINQLTESVYVRSLASSKG